MKCEYLSGENIRPRTADEAKRLIGKRVKYLLTSDIDRTGRGLFFPRVGTIAAARGKNIAIDHQANWSFVLRDIVEMTLA